jgi:hypothetical protein
MWYGPVEREEGVRCRGRLSTIVIGCSWCLTVVDIETITLGFQGHAVRG